MSPTTRLAYLENYRRTAIELHLYSPNTTLREAYALTPSDAKDLFESKPYEQWVEGRKTDKANVVAIAERLNSVISAVNNVTASIGKAFASMRRG